MPIRCVVWRLEGPISVREIVDIQKYGKIIHHLQVVSALMMELNPDVDIYEFEEFCRGRGLDFDGDMPFKNAKRKENS